MSGNLLIICITAVICALLLAFCHYNEHKEDLSTDRFEYLIQEINLLKGDVKLNCINFEKLRDDFNLECEQVMSGFEERDQWLERLEHEINDLGSRL